MTRLRKGPLTNWMAPGMRLDHRSYEEVKGEMTRAAAANGYLDAHLLGIEHMRVDIPQPHRRHRSRLETGPRYRFGKIDIDQDVIRPSLMRRFLRFREGEPFNTTEVLRTQFALDDSQYFSTVEVQPGERGQGRLTSCPCSMRADPNRRHRYSLRASGTARTRRSAADHVGRRRVEHSRPPLQRRARGRGELAQTPDAPLRHSHRRSRAREARLRGHRRAATSWPTSIPRTSTSSPASPGARPLAVGVVR